MTLVSIVKKIFQSHGTSSAEENLPPIQLLPTELALGIFAYLETADALACSTVCRQWKMLVSDDSLWKYFLKRDFRCDFQPSETESSPQELYRKKHLSNLVLNINLIFGICSERVCEAGSTPYPNHVHMEGREAFLSYGHEIEIWDLKSGACKKTLTDVHGKISPDSEKFVTLIPTTEGKFISGIQHSHEGPKIAIWDLETCTCTMTIPGSPDHVFLKEGKLIAHPRYLENINIYDVESGVLEKTIDRSSASPFQCAILSPDGKKLVYGVQCDIEIWDLESGICEMTLREHHTQLNTFAFTQDDKLISGGQRGYFYPESPGEIKIWNLQSGVCEMTLPGHDYTIISLIVTKSGKLISASEDGEIKIWNLKSGACEASYQINLLDKLKKGSITFSEEGELIVKLPEHKRDPHFKIFDFRASSTEIFTKLASRFDYFSNNNRQELHYFEIFDAAQDHELAMEKFSKMPAEERRMIYDEFLEIVGPVSHDDPNFAKHAFHDLKNPLFTPEQRATAIRKYLRKEQQYLRKQQPFAHSAACILF